jgi:Uma2 family endonuclease
MYDLPREEVADPGLPDEFHVIQTDFLKKTCRLPHKNRDEYFIAIDLNLYYDVRNPLLYKRPDWFFVLDISDFSQQQDLRLSYITWQEGINPFLVVELLSPGTEEEDLGQRLRDASKPPTKWQVYEQILRVPYYVVYDRYVNNLRVFRLQGSEYEELVLKNPKIWFKELQLGLGLWQGEYENTTGLWLRWFDSNNQWISTPEELAQIESLRAQEERLRAERERQRADRLAEYLRSQGIDPDNVAQRRELQAFSLRLCAFA